MKLTDLLPPPLLLFVLTTASVVAINPPATSPKTPEATVKSDVGTKDAPVDGWNGKPQQGPWARAGAEPVEKAPPAVLAEVPLTTTQQTNNNKKPAPKPLKEAPAAKPDTQQQQPDSVMDDPAREPPQQGTITGTEGGVTAREKDRKAQEEKAGRELERKPSPPPAAPPLPPSEEQKIKGAAAGDKKEATKTTTTLDDAKGKAGLPVEEMDKPKGAEGLKKPADLPDTPHAIPHPPPPSSGKVEDLEISSQSPGVTTTTDSSTTDSSPGVGIIRPLHSFVLSLTMILISEVGDKTFLIAALMAMKHARLLVFSAALAALTAMTVLSAVLGHAVPALVPKRLTTAAAAALFLLFGLKLLREGLAMSPNEGVADEMHEVERQLQEKDYQRRRRRRRSSPYALESGLRRARSTSRSIPARSPSSSRSRSTSPTASGATALAGLHNLLSLLLHPAWLQTFALTFLGEWGDRSQIATIAMAAGQDYWWVTAGAITGHACCTAVAVMGGRAIAGRVSLRVVSLGGAIAFLAFAGIYAAEAVYYSSTAA